MVEGQGDLFDAVDADLAEKGLTTRKFLLGSNNPNPNPAQEAAIAHRDEARQEATIQQRFMEFHRANPRVYELLVHFTRQAVSRGRAHVGAKAVFERMRWELSMTSSDEDGFKLNNDYSSRYARLIMENEPDLADVFYTRELRAR